MQHRRASQQPRYSGTVEGALPDKASHNQHQAAAQTQPSSTAVPQSQMHFTARSACVAVGILLLAVAAASVHPLTSKLKQKAPCNSMGCPIPPTSLCLKDRPPYICAHGGDTTQHPPNTAAAYAAALQAGADCMEVDATLTADLVLVALHDRDLQRLLQQPDAKVQDFSWSDLQRHRWPSGEGLMTVAEVLAQVAAQVQLVIIDMKTSPDISRVVQWSGAGGVLTEADALLAALQQLPHGNHSLVWGKSDELILKVQQAGLPVMTGFTIMMVPGTSLHNPARLQSAEVAAVYHGMLDASLMRELQAHRKKVIAWTVDEADDMRRLLHLGVDGLVTNAPGLLHSTLQAALLQCVHTTR